MNIISVSRRTDVPSFFAKWFLERLNQGFCQVLNPFNGKDNLVSLKEEDVIGFVFWSKNYILFQDILELLRERKYKFYLNYTVNNYPKKIENLTSSNEDIAKNLIKLSAEYTIFWRYDPIYVSRETDFDFHIKNFDFLSSIFQGRVNRVIINFIQEYPKVIRKLNNSFYNTPYEYSYLSPENKISFAEELKKIADKRGMRLTSCDEFLQKNTLIEKSRCVDKTIFENQTGEYYNIKSSPTFKGCSCHKSVDIGFYNSCKNGCVYCYAMNK
ncbi:MAG TPA: DUF1848 family protein [Spirochaetota bacterium]|nr:DUF1848 family protein [Spirochaetota bacterium]